MQSRAVLVALILPLIALAQSPLKFETFSSKEFGFSVLMPGTPMEKDRKASQFYQKTFSAVTTSPEAGWGVVSVDFPVGTGTKQNAEALLDDGVKRAVKSTDAKLLREGKITLDGKYPGRHFEMEMPSLKVQRGCYYLVRDRIYLVFILGDKEVTSAPEANKFLDSFKVTSTKGSLQFENFTSKDEGFSVMLPGKPTEENRTSSGGLPMKYVGVETLHYGKVTWSVHSTRFPKGTITEDNREAKLDAGVKAVMERVKKSAPLEAEIPVIEGKSTLDAKYPGRHFQMELPNSVIYRAQIYSVDDHSYQLTLIAPKEIASSPEATKFFESFKLAK